MIRKVMDHAYRNARRIAIGVLGGSVLLIGLALVVLPGPAFVVIPIGLAILGVEFAWARSWLLKVRQSISRRSFSPLAQFGDRD
jgi:Putative transmembrane protein (PGPGW)